MAHTPSRKPAHCRRARACQTSLWPSRCCVYTCVCRISLFHNCEDANTQGLMTHTDCHLPKKKEKKKPWPSKRDWLQSANLVMEDVNGSVRLWPQQDFGAHSFTSNTLSAQPKRLSRVQDLRQKPFCIDSRGGPWDSSHNTFLCHWLPLYSHHQVQTHSYGGGSQLQG